MLKLINSIVTILSSTFVKTLFEQHKETALFGKWITFKNIQPLFEKHKNCFEIRQLGFSELQKPIVQLKIGTGKKRILLWSQMHGNESTGTQALFDLFNCFSNSNEPILKTILKNCTLVFIPMLNPDGAEVYKRVNAKNIDLNRDAVDRLAVESNLLRAVLDDFNPKFCFNLHDQRTIFGVEGTKNPATISFLAPSEEISRSITIGRIQTMNVIVAMNSLLQQIIPNFIGRYTDEFYPTATGDNFQKLGYNTILIESGHFPDDYNRKFSREFTFYAILQGLFHIARNDKFDEYKSYFDIPNNKKMFFDVIHRNSNKKDIAYQYIDKIIDNQLVAHLEIVIGEDPKTKIGLNEIVFEFKFI